MTTELTYEGQAVPHLRLGPCPWNPLIYDCSCRRTHDLSFWLDSLGKHR